MAYRFELTRRALRDAEDAFSWIAQASPARAAHWYQGLFQKIRTLIDNPRRCSLAPESEAVGEEIRQLFYGKRRGGYRILFTVRDDLVRILAIRHSARQPLSAEALADEPEEQG